MASGSRIAQRVSIMFRSRTFRKAGIRPKSTYMVNTTSMVMGFFHIRLFRLRQYPPMTVSMMLISVPRPV